MERSSRVSVCKSTLFLKAALCLPNCWPCERDKNRYDKHSRSSALSLSLISYSLYFTLLILIKGIFASLAIVCSFSFYVDFNLYFYILLHCELHCKALFQTVFPAAKNGNYSHYEIYFRLRSGLSGKFEDTA